MSGAAGIFRCDLVGMERKLPQLIDREEAIDILRAGLLARLDGDTSVCRYAAERGVLCRGFARYTDQELRERYAWIVRRRPKISRSELEQIADRWQLAQQEVSELPTACDVEAKVHDTCRGWDDFSNAELSRFVMQISGRSVIVA